MKKLFIIFICCFSSCIIELPTVPELLIDFVKIEGETTTLSDSAKLYMNGVYTVITGTEILGNEVVGKWIKKRWCLYCKQDVVYSENAGGSRRDSILMNGYIRVVRSGSGSRISFLILPEEGASNLVSDEVPPILILRGITSDGKNIILQRTRALYQPIDTSDTFYIIAHRGGGRNSERLGRSENSLEMIKYAQILGATGVEIDVKRTRDGKVILFHDETFSPRTVNSAYLLGRVENFDLAQIKLFGQLIYGESIPTLEEALQTVIDSTVLSVVWLDVKDPGIVDEVIRIQKLAISNANRPIKIYFGIPNEDILNAYRSSNLSNTTPVLIELGSEVALSNNCEVWAPRWTNGIQSAEIDALQNRGKKVFVWTLDVHSYIEDFLYRSKVDGILSDYPSLVASMYYSRE